MSSSPTPCLVLYVCPTKSTQWCSCACGSRAGPGAREIYQWPHPQRRAFFLPSRSQLATAPQLGVGLGLLPLHPCWNFGCLSFLGQVATESWAHEYGSCVKSRKRHSTPRTASHGSPPSPSALNSFPTSSSATGSSVFFPTGCCQGFLSHIWSRA